jgi:flagellar protein FlaI
MVAKERAETFHEQANTNPHLRHYIDGWILGGGELPEFHSGPKRAMARLHKFNILYPVREPCYVHVHKSLEGEKMYVPIEPVMDQKTLLKYNEVLDSMAEGQRDPADGATYEQKREALRARFREIDAQKGGSPLSGLLRALHLGGRPRLNIRVQIEKEDRSIIGYHIIRDLMGHGILEPIVWDPHVDQMRSTGAGRLGVMHGVWGPMETAVQFKDAAQLDALFWEFAQHPGANWSRWRTISFRTSTGKTGSIRR